MTCDQQNEMLRFVWRNKSFRFAVLAAFASETKRTVVRWAMELAGLGDLRARRPFVGATRRPHASRSDAQHRVSKGGQKRPTLSLRLWSVPFDKLRAGFRGRAAALQNEVWGTPRREKSGAEAHLSP
jgi:hypothetical protein